MRYLLTIYDLEGRYDDLSPDQLQAEIDAHWAIDRDAMDRGVFVDSAPLQPASSAVTLRIRDGEQELTDGPFAETKEQLGGYYLLDCASVEEALEWAARMPSARFGSVEVREVLDMGPAPWESGEAVARSR
jgi:hypothetical protein